MVLSIFAHKDTNKLRIKKEERRIIFLILTFSYSSLLISSLLDSQKTSLWQYK